MLMTFLAVDRRWCWLHAIAVEQSNQTTGVKPGNNSSCRPIL